MTYIMTLLHVSSTILMLRLINTDVSVDPGWLGYWVRFQLYFKFCMIQYLLYSKTHTFWQFLGTETDSFWRLLGPQNTFKICFCQTLSMPDPRVDFASRDDRYYLYRSTIGILNLISRSQLKYKRKLIISDSDIGSKNKVPPLNFALGSKSIKTLSFGFMFIFTSLCGNDLASNSTHMFHTCSFNYKHPYIVSINIFLLLK